MRILFAVSIPFPEGGANTQRISTIAREMVRQGQDVTLLIPFARKKQPSVQVVDGIRVKWCYVPRSVRVLKNSRGYVRFTVQLIARTLFIIKVLLMSFRDEYDWIYLYQPGLDGVVAALLARLTGHSVCSEYVDEVSLGSNLNLFWKIICCTLMIADVLAPKLSSVIFVISSTLEKRYRRLAPKAKIVCIPTIVNTKKFNEGDPSFFRSKLNLREEKILVYAGSLTKPQGVRNLIAAVPYIVPLHANFKLLIAGGSMALDHDDVPALIQEYEVADYVMYLGVLGFHSVVDLLSCADILVVPKLDLPVNHAGFSTKLAEYLAAGKPVVASRVGDISQYLTHEQSAMLCDPGDTVDLAEKIAFLLSNDDLAKSVAEKGKHVALMNFDVKPNVSKMILSLTVEMC